MRFTFLIVAVFAPAGIAIAQVPPPPVVLPAPPPSAAAIAAARKFVDASDLRGQAYAVFPQLAVLTLSKIRQHSDRAAWPAAVDQQISAAFKDFMASLYAGITSGVLDQYATIYARHFSAAELNRLTKLISDPAMVRLRKLSPDLTIEFVTVSDTAFASQQEEFKRRANKIFADWIAAHPEDKSKLPPTIAS